MLEIQQKGNMKNHINTLKNCLLFKNIDPNNILSLLCCLGAKVCTYNKNEHITQNKNKISGILISGLLQIIQYDYYGNRTIIASVEPLQLFGETYSFTNEQFPFEIIASENSVIITFDTANISSPCHNHCQFHIKLIQNFLQILSTKNIALNKKLQCLAKRTTREKLLNYLSSEAIKNNSNEFSIPYDRQSLADYLCVERSAMAMEISKLRNEKIIECTKNKFKLL